MSIFSDYYRKDLSNLEKQITPKGESANYTYLINTLAYTEDIQQLATKIRKNTTSNSRIVVIYFNFLWKPLLQAASKLGLRKNDLKEPNWLSQEDVRLIFGLENFEVVKSSRRLLLPINVPVISTLTNKYLARLPIIDRLCLTYCLIFRAPPPPGKYSISIIIPARNEEENVHRILSKIPRMGKFTEVIFVEGGSTDNTLDAIHEEIKRYQKTKDNTVSKISLYRQKGKGKGDAVRLGFSKASGDILTILDADLTVKPSDLPKFYNALAKGKCEFANGTRLIYPMEKQAMRTLNYMGNKVFSILFSYLLDQRVTDTLCGTKALFRNDYEKIAKNRKFFGNFDPFGDFDLLFGASKQNLKIVEIPVRYRERIYGTTNINRFSHGVLLIKMTFFAAKKLKFT